MWNIKGIIGEREGPGGKKGTKEWVEERENATFSLTGGV